MVFASSIVTVSLNGSAVIEVAPLGVSFDGGAASRRRDRCSDEHHRQGETAKNAAAWRPEQTTGHLKWAEHGYRLLP